MTIQEAKQQINALKAQLAGQSGALREQTKQQIRGLKDQVVKMKAAEKAQAKK